MDFATGALSTLLPKLGELLHEEYNLQKSVKQGVKDLRDELLIMQAALEKVSEVPLDQLDPVVKIWANDVRDLSYVIEDSLDSFMVRVEGLEPTTKLGTFMGFIKNTHSKVTKFKIRHEIASDIKDIERQVRKVKERYDRYKVDDVVANHGATTVDPRLVTLYSKVSNLVGIDGAIVELMKRLSEGDDTTDKRLKTVSIVGFGGLGKTTLAKAVYDKLKTKFDCGGIIPVGQKPNMEKVLKDILYELDKQKYMNISASKMDVRQLIDELRDCLMNKRYFIVIDDIWDITTWEKIKCAFVDSNPEARIIITTRICEVAKRVGGVYDIKPLSEENSKKLFNTRILSGAGICPDDHPAEVSDKILRKCGGVPLSIITIASLLVDKKRDDWSKVYDSIGFGHEDNEAVQNARKIISFSFYDLDYYLKNCLLYLSVYPDDYWIVKNQLIWVWVAEGLIPAKQGIGVFELGERYFNELVNRSMIRSTEPSSRRSVSGCSVHDMVLDLVRTTSRELNFVIIHDMEQENTCPPNRSNTVHRLSIQRRSAELNLSMEMGHVRSFSAMDCKDFRMPPLLSFKVLRVLVLGNCDFSMGYCCLENLGKLLQLRYLGLWGTLVAELPREIGNLKLLQTLYLGEIGTKELPSSVSELKNLRYLFASEGTVMMGEVGKLKALEELWLHSVEKCPNFITDLGELTEMRVLRITFAEMDNSLQKSLVESLQNLRRIQTLMIDLESEDMGCPCLHSFEVWAPPRELHELSLSGIKLSRRPSWMDFSYVPHLTYLNYEVKVLEVRDLQILGQLPLLRFLFICSSTCSSRPYTTGSDEFKNLGYLNVSMNIVCGEGALPMLHTLDCAASMGKHVGFMGNMPLLQDVTYWLHCGGFSVEEVEDAEAALQHAAAIHPNHPTLTIKRWNYEPDNVEWRIGYLRSLERRYRRVNLRI